MHRRLVSAVNLRFVQEVFHYVFSMRAYWHFVCLTEGTHEELTSI